jgi:hypothetical protein
LAFERVFCWGERFEKITSLSLSHSPNCLSLSLPEEGIFIRRAFHSLPK